MMSEPVEQHSFHLKYRPRTFDEIIGHKDVVTRLRGMVKSGKIPNALFITGPSSVGKTTIARCLTAELNNVKDVAGSSDYIEMNAGESRSIEDIRQLIQTSKFRPQKNRRVIVIDEAQGILGNNVAAQCFSATTYVKTEQGKMTIAEIHDRIERGLEVRVASFNHNTNEIEYKKVLQSRKQINKKACIGLGQAVSTIEHPVWDTTKNTYVPASTVNEVLILKEV